VLSRRRGACSPLHRPGNSPVLLLTVKPLECSFRRGPATALEAIPWKPNFSFAEGVGSVETLRVARLRGSFANEKIMSDPRREAGTFLDLLRCCAFPLCPFNGCCLRDLCRRVLLIRQITWSNLRRNLGESSFLNFFCGR
jgi:hypothetical protein